MKELRSELNRLQAEFDQKWSSQIKLVNQSLQSQYLFIHLG